MSPTDMIDTIHGTGAAAQAGELAALIVQLGRDEMAVALVELLDAAGDDDAGYREGVEDAITALVQAGASDPR